MKRNKGEVAIATVIVILLGMFGVLATNGGKTKTAQADTVQVAEAK